MARARERGFTLVEVLVALGIVAITLMAGLQATTALTRKEVDALFQVILRLKQQGISILFVSHKLNEVFEISDRFTIFRNGELVKSGHTGELDAARFTYYMTGREFAPGKFIADVKEAVPLMEVSGLSMSGAFADVSVA